MRDTDSRDGWDFTPVISLIHSFQNATENAKIQDSPEDVSEQPEDKVVHADIRNGPNGLTSHLGDFENIWRFLGCPVEAQAIVKEVRWRDELDGADLADNDEIDDSSKLKDLTKSQRKKARKKEKRKILEDGPPKLRKAIPGSNEADSEDDRRDAKIADRKAIIHDLLDRPLPSRQETTVGMQVVSRS